MAHGSTGQEPELAKLWSGQLLAAKIGSIKVSRKLEEEEESGRHEGTDDQIKVRSFIVTWSVSPIVGRLILVEFLSRIGRTLFNRNK